MEKNYASVSSFSSRSQGDATALKESDDPLGSIYFIRDSRHSLTKYSREGLQGKPRSGGRKKWPWVVGALVLLAVILGAVLGGVFGSRAANDNKSNNVNGNANNNNNGAASAATRTKGSGNEAVVPTVSCLHHSSQILASRD